jgi:uncharacterized protein (DUF427 family)
MSAPAPSRREPCPKRLRGYVAGRLAFDTTGAWRVWEDRPYPAYFIPVADVTPGVAREAGRSGPVEGTVAFRWDALDSWFEEDEEVFVHPRDPYTRVDILPSSRRVRIEVAGTVLAESAHPHVLFETGLPTRWYLPKVDVRMDLLTPTATVTQCPYKGTAEYWSAAGVTDVAWSYRTPLPESRRAAGLVCFYNEKVDLYVNDQLQARPALRW